MQFALVRDTPINAQPPQESLSKSERYIQIGQRPNGDEASCELHSFNLDPN